MLGPALDISSPGDQGIAVPETDRLAIPLGHLLHVLAADQYFAQEVVGNTREELHTRGRDAQLEVSATRGPRPPAGEAFRQAKGGAPLLRVIHRLVVEHLDVALLILRSKK